MPSGETATATSIAKDAASIGGGKLNSTVGAARWSSLE